MGTRYICGVLPMCVEVGGMSGGQVPGKGTQPGKTQGTLHVSEMVFKGCNPTGGPSTTPTVQPLWNSHAGVATG